MNNVHKFFSSQYYHGIRVITLLIVILRYK